MGLGPRLRPELREELLVALDRSRHHRRKKQDERQILADVPSFRFAFVAIRREVDELEREKRNSQRQKCVRPIMLLRCAKPHQSRKKVPVFKYKKQDDCLRYSHPTKPRFRPLEPPADELPTKNSQT